MTCIATERLLRTVSLSLFAITTLFMMYGDECRWHSYNTGCLIFKRGCIATAF